MLKLFLSTFKKRATTTSAMDEIQLSILIIFVSGMLQPQAFWTHNTESTKRRIRLGCIFCKPQLPNVEKVR